MPPDARPIASRCKRASNTSAATKRRATSARRRCFSPSWPRCMRSITDRTDCGESPGACMTSPAAWPTGLEQLGYELGHEDFFDTIRVGSGERSSGEFLRRACKETATCASSAPTASGFRSTKRPRLTTSRSSSTSSAKTESCFRESALGKSQIANRKSQIRFSHPSGLQHAPHRDRNAALPAPARIARSFALPLR